MTWRVSEDAKMFLTAAGFLAARRVELAVLFSVAQRVRERGSEVASGGPHAVYVPATADVVPAPQRSTAFGVILAAGLLLGGAGGPVAVGSLSSVLEAGSEGMSAAAASASALQMSMLVLVPLAILVAAGMFLVIARSSSAAAPQ